MKKSVLVSGLFVAAALASQSALAEVKVRAGVASASYNLSGNYTHAKANYTPVNVGVTFSADNGFYVDLAVSGGKGKHDGWAQSPTSTIACGGTVCNNTASAKEDFTRNDYALIVGGSHLNPDNGLAITIYGGLKGGTTTLDAKNTGLAWTYDKFDTNGVVVGGGASYPIAGGRAGAVGVNLGVGVMGGTWKDSTGWNVKAKTTVGVSLGANYTYPVTPSFGVIADLKTNAYNYKFDWGTKTLEVNETFTSLGVMAYVKF